MHIAVEWFKTKEVLFFFYEDECFKYDWNKNGTN